MSTMLRNAMLIVATVVLLQSASSAFAQDADFKCRHALAGAYATYVKTVTTAMQKCNDADVAAGLGAAAPGGDFNCGKVGVQSSVAMQKLVDAITKKCEGEGIAPGAIGWPAQCPDFEGLSYLPGVCAAPFPTNSAANVGVCLALCVGRPAFKQAMDLFYLDLASPAGNAAIVTCQSAIGKEATKFLQTSQKTLGKCRAAVDKGTGALPCPDPGDGKAAAALAKARSKTIDKICKACGATSPDGVSCGSGGLAPSQIGFVSECPSVTVPFGGPSCGGPIADLDDLVHCVSCVSTFKASCLDAVSRPDQATFPAECAATLPTVTPTPTATPTPTLTPIGGQTATPTATAAQPTATFTPPPSVCGNNVREGTEECDGTDDAGCPGNCLGSCSCGPSTCGGSTCNGGCGFGESCFLVAAFDLCTCVPTNPQPCIGGSFPTCGGSCPSGFTCQALLDPFSNHESCTCFPSSQTCSTSTMCSVFPGVCPDNSVCLSGADISAQPPNCGQKCCKLPGMTCTSASDCCLALSSCTAGTCTQ